MTQKKDLNDTLFYIFIVLFVIVFIGGFIFMIAYIGISTIHDSIYEVKEYQSEFLLLDDVQYMDDGDILYRFGDTVIKDRLIDTKFNVNIKYEVVYIKYTNSWLYENDVWKYHEIRPT